MIILNNKILVVKIRKNIKVNKKVIKEQSKIKIINNMKINKKYNKKGL